VCSDYNECVLEITNLEKKKKKKKVMMTTNPEGRKGVPVWVV